jgi:hypothetical protein
MNERYCKKNGVLCKDNIIGQSGSEEELTPFNSRAWSGAVFFGKAYSVFIFLIHSSRYSRSIGFSIKAPTFG